MQAMHEFTISRGYNKVNFTKHGEFGFVEKHLFSCYIKQIMNVFSFVQWNKYFHSVKDENISSFTS